MRQCAGQNADVWCDTTNMVQTVVVLNKLEMCAHSLPLTTQGGLPVEDLVEQMILACNLLQQGNGQLTREKLFRG